MRLRMLRSMAIKGNFLCSISSSHVDDCKSTGGLAAIDLVALLGQEGLPRLWCRELTRQEAYLTESDLHPLPATIDIELTGKTKAFELAFRRGILLSLSSGHVRSQSDREVT